LNFKTLEALLASIGRLTSLETLNIERCYALRELPASISAMTRLTSLRLRKRGLNLKELPSSLGDLQALKSLKLQNLLVLEALTTSIARLTSLETLYIELCDKLQELPETIVALTNLHELSINGCPMTALPASIGALTNLTKLFLFACELMDVPSSIESLTALRYLRLNARPDGRAFQTLSCALPSLRLLQELHLHKLGEDDVLAIGRSLKVRPLPLLNLDSSSWKTLKCCWQALGLQPAGTT